MNGLKNRDRQKSYYHRGGEPSLLGGTIDEHFGSTVRRYPEHEALVGCPQGRRLNYRELDRAVEKLAPGLLGIGFSRGDRIGIWSTNNVEWLLILTSREDTLEHRLETVGTNIPHQEVKIISRETGQTVPLGEVGEVCFRGYHVMRGYYGDAEATRKAMDDAGWLRSGDLGIMEAGGYLRITGRLKEMIIRGGENIYPREIEDLLFTHPKIAEVAVFGIPDEYYGEAVVAWIQLHEAQRMTEEEVREFCRGNIAHFKIPGRICFVHTFPMTVTGKLQKFRMQEMEIAGGAGDAG